MKKLVIEKADLVDFDKIDEIEKLCFSAPFPKEIYINDLLTNPYSVYYKLCYNDKIIGYFGLWLIYENVQITTIAVSPEYQGLGYSKLMLEYIISLVKAQMADNITLEVRKSNEKAINLYQKFNFYKVSVRKAYYEDGEDAFLMKLDLSE